MQKLKLYDYAVTFQEVPDEISLILNISNCPHKCEGCHSPHLRNDIGEYLTDKLMIELLRRYKGLISCVCFMGGDYNRVELMYLFEICKENNLKICLYSGCNDIPAILKTHVDMYKIGPYVKERGGLDSNITNQNYLVKTDSGAFINQTYKFKIKKE
jgi:anaerobic ribonucleoside-triphosphate reductase activating protein